MLSWRTARQLSGVFAVAALAVGALVHVTARSDGVDVVSGASAAMAPSAPAAEPAEVTESAIPTTPPAEREPVQAPEARSEPASVVAELEADKLASFSMLGVTWESGLDDSRTHVEVRWRADDKWSSWTELHSDPAPEEGGRAGTEPQWVGDADGAQVRVTSDADAAPRGLALSTIDPASTNDNASATTVMPAVAMMSAASVATPRIVVPLGVGSEQLGIV